jgi:DNA-directed RNA polymerase subunit H (RpoH/RPB5)
LQVYQIKTQHLPKTPENDVCFKNISQKSQFLTYISII